MGATRKEPKFKRASFLSELAIEYRPIKALIPYARNAQTHSDARIARRELPFPPRCRGVNL
jgi:hypothetical protein